MNSDYEALGVHGHVKHNFLHIMTGKLLSLQAIFMQTWLLKIIEEYRMKGWMVKQSSWLGLIDFTQFHGFSFFTICEFAVVQVLLIINPPNINNITPIQTA
jgi:hypothetical protein